MRAAITESEKRMARLQREHLARVEECRPLLDKSIPLGRSVFHDSHAVKRYYEEKSRRGIPDKYPGLR